LLQIYYIWIENHTVMAKNELQETLDGITFKNSQVQKIREIQEGKSKVKDSVGRAKQRVSSSSKIKGLQGLQGLQSIGSSIEK
jgi:hypothetical protein